MNQAKYRLAMLPIMVIEADRNLERLEGSMGTEINSLLELRLRTEEISKKRWRSPSFDEKKQDNRGIRPETLS